MLFLTNVPAPDPAQAKQALREGIETSRQLVKQSRVLIELTESDVAWPSAEEGIGAAN